MIMMMTTTMISLTQDDGIWKIEHNILIKIKFGSGNYYDPSEESNMKSVLGKCLLLIESIVLKKTL